MKLLFCEDCKDIITPFYRKLSPRWCNCNRHAVWWADDELTQLFVLDYKNMTRDIPRHARCYIIGLSNRGLLMPDHQPWTAERVRELLMLPKPDTLFAQTNSLVFRVRPGEVWSAQWATTLPKHWNRRTSK